MHASDGILTSRGGLTSHAAVVARGLDLYTSKGGSWTRISSPDYGQASVMATVDTDTSVKLTGLNQIPKIGDTFTIEDSYRDYSIPYYSMNDGRFHKPVYIITKVEDYNNAYFVSPSRFVPYMYYQHVS